MFRLKFGSKELIIGREKDIEKEKELLKEKNINQDHRKTLEALPIMDSERSLTIDEMLIYYTNRCPDCQSSLYYGPGAGMAQNMLCPTQNNGCGAVINDFGDVMRPIWIERFKVLNKDVLDNTWN